MSTAAIHPALPRVPSTATTVTSKKRTGHFRVAASRGSAPVQLYYELHGDGPRKIVLIMGLNTTCQNWDLQTKYFGEMPEYQVLCFDNRGVGLSSTPPGLYSTSEMAADAWELILSLGPEWRQGIHGAGISMGGMVLQELALLAPPRTFASLAFLSTTAGRSLPTMFSVTGMPALMREPNPLVRIGKLMDVLYSPEWRAAPPTNSYAKRAMEVDGKQYKTNKDWAMDMALQRANRSPGPNPQGSLGQLAAAGLHHVSAQRLDRIRRLGIETLVLTGTWDNLVRPSNSTYLAHHLRAPLIVLDGCGHAPISERVDEVNAHLLAHFAKGHARYAVERTLWASHEEEDASDEEGEFEGFSGGAGESGGEGGSQLDEEPALTVVRATNGNEEVISGVEEADGRLREMGLEATRDEEDNAGVAFDEMKIMCI